MYMQHMSYYVLIARFMPRVEIVQKQNSTVRRLYIQGHNGKVSTYTSGVPFLNLIGLYMYMYLEGKFCEGGN